MNKSFSFLSKSLVMLLTLTSIPGLSLASNDDPTLGDMARSSSSAKPASTSKTKATLEFKKKSSSSKPPEGGGSEKPPEGGGSEKPPEGGGSEKPPEGGGSEKPPEGGGNEKPPGGGGSEKPPEGGGSEKPPGGGGSEKPPEGGGSEKPPEGGGSEKPPEGGGESPSNPGVVPPDNPGGTPIAPPDDGSQGSNDDLFTLNWVSYFKFGGIELKDGVMQKFAEPVVLDSDVLYAPFIQVTDNRKDATGWNLSVNASEFKTEFGDTLKGVSFDFLNVTAIPSSNQPLSEAPSFSTGKELMTDSSQLTLIDAKSGNGSGIWTFSFTDDDKGFYKSDKGIRINIPEHISPKLDKSYESVMEWTLSSLPT